MRPTPEAAADWNNLGLRLQRKGKISDALHAHQKAMSLQPSNTTILYNLGRMYRLMGKHDLAINALSRSQQIEPADLETKIELGISYLGIGEYKIVWEYFDERIEWRGETVSGKSFFIWLEQGLGD